MKNVSKLVTLTLSLLLVVTFTTFAGTKEKAIAKATEVVENGSPDDWKLLAQQADFLIRKDAGLGTAKEWIEKSLSIKEGAYNLEVMGDYFMASNLPSQAIPFYIKSADMVKAGNPKANTVWLQEKMAQAAQSR